MSKTDAPGSSSELSFPRNNGPLDPSKRSALATTAVLGGIGSVAAAVPFVATFTPSERAKAAGAPVEANISALKAGEMMRVEWRGNPVWIVRRTDDMLASLDGLADELVDPQSEKYYQIPTPDYARNQHRSIKPEYLVVVGICPHLGCSPSTRFEEGAQPSLPSDWPGGFLCPCHGSTFDMAGRVFKNKPANVNLDVPPHMYLSDATILIGEDQNA